MVEERNGNFFQNRRCDLDALRTGALFLLIVYHAALSFQEFASYIGFPQNRELLEWLMVPGALLNIWRIPILFIISGMVLVYSLERSHVKDVIRHRLTRIGLPLGLGWLIVGPVGFFLSQIFYGKEASYVPNPLHLWFLQNIIVYILIGSLFFFLFLSSPCGFFRRTCYNIFGSIHGLFVTLLLAMGEGFLTNPGVYAWFLSGLHGWSIGFICFMLGMLYANSGENFWKVVCRFRIFTFSTAFLLYLYRLFEYRLENVPAYLVGLESMLWIWAILGFSHVYLNRDSPIFIYLRSAVFPVYILHQPIQYALAFLIFPAEIPAFLKFILLVVGVLIVSFGIYEFLLRRIGYIAPYFGMRYIK